MAQKVVLINNNCCFYKLAYRLNNAVSISKFKTNVKSFWDLIVFKIEYLIDPVSAPFFSFETYFNFSPPIFINKVPAD